MKKKTATFTVYQEDGKFPSKSFGRRRLWRWRLTSRSGNIIADGGEGYATKGSALRAVRRLGAMLRSEPIGIEIERA